MPDPAASSGWRDRIIDGLRWRGLALKEKGWGRSLAGQIMVDTLLWPADCRLCFDKYRAVFGHNPHIMLPGTFNEKLQRSKLLGRHQRHICYADKLAVRNFVKERVGQDVLVELLWEGNDLAGLEALRLAPPYIIKSNHASGTNLIVMDHDQFDWADARSKAEKWFSRSHDTYAGEWQYRWIKPRLFAERLLPSPPGEDLIDYKFFCFHGKARYLQVDKNRHTYHTRALFECSGKRLEAGLHYPRHTGPIQLPSCLPELIRVAELLSRDEAFLRVDLYEVDGKPVFGEMTMHPGAGLERFDPASWDVTFGKCW